MDVLAIRLKCRATESDERNLPILPFAELPIRFRKPSSDQSKNQTAVSDPRNSGALIIEWTPKYQKVGYVATILFNK